jgi:hypothetical protein
MLLQTRRTNTGQHNAKERKLHRGSPRLLSLVTDCPCVAVACAQLIECRKSHQTPWGLGGINGAPVQGQVMGALNPGAPPVHYGVQLRCHEPLVLACPAQAEQSSGNVQKYTGTVSCTLHQLCGRQAPFLECENLQCQRKIHSPGVISCLVLFQETARLCHA